MLVVQTMGVLLDTFGGYGFDSFRVAWLAQYPIWVLALVGVLITRKKARRESGVYPRTLRQILRARTEPRREELADSIAEHIEEEPSDNDGGRS